MDTRNGHAGYGDYRPYCAPAPLDSLKGPETGTVTAPISAYWGPDPRFDLDSDANAITFYKLVLNQGTTDDIESLLNRNLLERLWPDLFLPAQCREAREKAFSSLQQCGQGGRHV